LEGLDKVGGHADVLASIMSHRADACSIEASRTVRKVAAETHDSADCLLEAAGLDRGLVGAATGYSLEVVVDAEPADNRVGVDRKSGEAGRGHGNAGRGSDDKALVRGKGKTAVDFKFLLDVISKAGSICGTFVFGRGRGGRREVIDMKGQQGTGMSLLNGLQGWGQKEPQLIGGRCRASCDAAGGPKRGRDIS
jgi:hypothetical protein